MKRKLSLFLALIMLVTVLLPVQSFAEGEKGLEDAIKIAKSKFTIPENYSEFNYNISTEGSKKIWYLTWSSKDGVDGSTSISVDEKGSILMYNSYKPYDYNQKRLAKLNRKEAQIKAEEFIKKMNPDLVSQVKLLENTQTTIMEPVYNFNYSRIVNGIPFYFNFMSVDVNRETGEVQGYRFNWSDDIVFPAVDKVISIEEAQKAYIEKLGLRLTYNYVMEDQKIKIYAAYTPKYGLNYHIDALTGEKILLEPDYYGWYSGGAMNEKMMSRAADSSFKVESPVITPDELKAVEKVSKLISKEQAEKIAREIPQLELNADYKVVNANLSRDWMSREDFIWQLYFETAPKEDMKEMRSVNINIDALTAEIKGFYTNFPYRDSAEAKYDEKASKAEVEKFLKAFRPAKFAETEYDESFSETYNVYMTEKMPKSYTFRFIRKANGVLFPGNMLTVGYDAVNGKVTNYDMTWFNAEFPTLSKVVPIDGVYEKMFKDIGLELQYVRKFPSEYFRKVNPDAFNTKPEIKLIYSVKRNKPLSFDANSGVIIDANGKPYKESKPVEYTDISGSFAEKQIKVLAEQGIALEGSEFKPGDNIIQKDFLFLLSKTLNYYMPEPLTATMKDNEIEQLYTYLIREGIVKATEKSPDAVITREECVKFIIRALKYDKVADIKGIYVCNFADAKTISSDLVGYVAIAQGLRIVSGNNGLFKPKSNLTRAEAAVIIYNYLQK